MTENLANTVVPQAPNTASTPGYGWDDVARDMDKWHPGLQEHAARLVEQHGAGTPEQSTARPDHISVPHLAVVENPQEAAPIPNTVELDQNSAEKIAEAFDDGQRAMLKLSNDPKFHARCLEKGIDPYDDMDKPEYWRLFAEHGQERAAVLREKAGNNPKISAIELMASTPAYIFDQVALKRREQLAPAEKQRARETASGFNSMIRKFADDFPDTSVSEMAAALFNTANMTIEDPAVRRVAPAFIGSTIRGAQHEKVFGQILEATGEEYREANRAEDLKGFDYVTKGSNGRPMYIDVKASLNDVERRNTQAATPEADVEEAFIAKAFAHNGNRTVMYSLVTDRELDDKFYLPDDAIAAKAPILREILDQASAEQQERRRA